jgi:hypothetical protein
MDVKAIFLVTFDIIVGPIAYINKLTPQKIEYLEFLENAAHLGEFYAGISHAQIEKVTTKTDDELIVGRAKRKVDETELIDVAVALVGNAQYQKEIAKMLNFAVRTAYGDPENFTQLLDRVLLEYQEIGKKTPKRKRLYKDLAKEKIRNVGKTFKNWNGILFIDFEGDKVNSSYIPDWIEAAKIDPVDIAEKTREMYRKGIILPRAKQKFTLVSLKSKQAIVVATTNMRFVTVIFPTAEGLTKLKNITENMDVLNEAIREAGLTFNKEAMKKTLERIDEKITKEEKKPIEKETAVVMIRAGELMPKKTITQEEYELFEGKLQKQFFEGCEKAFKEFEGEKTILKIAHKMDYSLEKLADFTVFCMTRGIIQVFAQNGSHKRKSLYAKNNLIMK